MRVKKNNPGDFRIVIEQLQFDKQSMRKTINGHNHPVPVVALVSPSLALLAYLLDTGRTTNADVFARSRMISPALNP
jgi:metallophosphoesterase superfamily enzyme